MSKKPNKRGRSLNRIRLYRWLKAQGEQFNNFPSDNEIIKRASARLGNPKETKSAPNKWGKIEQLVALAGGLTTPIDRKKKQPTTIETQIKEFYASFAWRQIRYQIFKEHGRRCLLCGAAPPDVVLHIDHIKPLRFNWELRLDPSNLQVLCEVCNHGKGNRDQTDWRSVTASAV